MDKEFYSKVKETLDKALKSNPNSINPKMIRELKFNFDKLYDLTIKEEKTRLYNHRYFMLEFKKEIERSVRYNHQLTLLMIDLDSFKEVNDTYGHDKGDEVLKRVAVVIKNALRVGDFPARFGGEEFVVMLPETGPRQAYRVAERLRIAILADPYLGHFNVSASIGISTLDGAKVNNTFRDSTQATPHELLKKSDKALLWVKKHGKNQTKLWEENL